jgi:hypothetical protein
MPIAVATGATNDSGSTKRLVSAIRDSGSRAFCGHSVAGADDDVLDGVNGALGHVVFQSDQDHYFHVSEHNRQLRPRSAKAPYPWPLPGKINAKRSDKLHFRKGL